jgi:ATP-dependent Clp protease ATP-binding subunit ClpB
MTSNIGSHEIQAAFESNPEFEKAEKVAKEQLMKLLKTQLRPEFLNRIDDIVLFSPLTQKEIKKIVALQFEIIALRIKAQGVEINATNEALDQLALLGFDPQYGGRPVKRVLQQQILNPLSKKLLGNALDKNHRITVDYFDGKFVFRNS